MNKEFTNQGVFRPATVGMLTGMLILTIGIVTSVYLYQLRVKSETAEIENVLNFVQRNIQQTITESFAILLTLSFTVDDDGNVSDFEEVAETLIRNYPAADVLELVPGGVIEYVYPLEGNESVIGYDIANDPKVSEEVQKAAERGTIYFAGPITLKQGGEAVIGRLPIIRNGELWGFSAVVIYLETLIQQSGIYDFPDDRYHFQLTKVNPNTGENEFFLPQAENADLKNFYSVNFPEGDWRIYITKIQTLPTVVILFFYLGASLFGAFLCGFLVYTILKRPYELEVLLHEKSEELLQSREMFKQKTDLLTSVLESPQNMLIFSIDKDYRYLEFNNNHAAICKKIFGKTISVGDSILEIVGERIAPALKERYDRALRGESFAFDEESTLEYDLPQYWRNRFSPIRDKNGNIFGLTVFSNNITQRVQTEKELARNEGRYRTLISNSPYSIHELDTEGKLTSMNRAGLDMLGLEKEEDIIGKPVTDIFGEDEAVPVMELFEKCLKGESSEFILQKDGQHLASSFVPIKDPDGNVIRVMGITQDITQRKKSEEFIENSLREKTTLLAEIHHRVKNNLAIVSGLLELQRYRTDDPKLISAFEESISRIISIAMVHEMMYNTTDLSSINIHSYLEKLIPAISNTMRDPDKEVLFDLKIDDYRLNINESIPLGLLFNELITNSFKYAFDQKAGNTIRIELKVKNKKVSVIYEDNGRGFGGKEDFENPKNLGLTLIHAQLKQLEADYSVVTEDKFRLSFSFSLKEHGAHSSFERSQN